jgi:hypothetical protein
LAGTQVSIAPSSSRWILMDIISYIDPIRRKPYLFPVNMILITSATIMVCLRMYARFFHTRSAGLDDYMIIAALPMAIALTVTVSLASTKYGWDRHIWDVDPGPHNENLVMERLISWISQMLYHCSSSLTKLSLLVFYRRIFVTKTMKWIVMGVICFTIAYFLTFFFALIFECRPLSHYWHILVVPEGTGGVCADEGDLVVISGIINVLIDVVIFILPIKTVIDLKIALVQKLQVLAIFAAGLFVIMSSTIRILATDATTRHTYDVTWAGYLVWMWIGIEVDVGLICASVPACRSLFKVWTQRIHTSRSRSTAPSTKLSSLGGIKKSTSTYIEGSYQKMDDSSTIGLTSEERLASSGKSNHQHKSWKESVGGGTSSARAWAGKDEEYDLEYSPTKNGKNLPAIPSPSASIATFHPRDKDDL